jgi:hypothetical protein
VEAGLRIVATIWMFWCTAMVIVLAMGRLAYSGVMTLLPRFRFPACCR